MTITAQELVRREVHYCVSSLVSTLAFDYGDLLSAEISRETIELAEQAAELCTPLDDWEEAATQAGWTESSTVPGAFTHADGRAFSSGTDIENGWRNLCDAEQIDPYQWEVFEHWIVSEWLARKLDAEGEKISLDFAGLPIWARTTTGQAIYADSVMERIAASLNTER